MWINDNNVKSFNVSLFVRLWVEIWQNEWTFRQDLVSLFVRLWVEMFRTLHLRYSFVRQPLREAVSWNDEQEVLHPPQIVSLFVRLWVEILRIHLCIIREPVSLFVRLWVEIHIPQLLFLSITVSLFVRLWIEIKCQDETVETVLRQLLREAVSWNFCKKCNRIHFFVSFFIRLWVGRKQR